MILPTTRGPFEVVMHVLQCVSCACTVLYLLIYNSGTLHKIPVLDSALYQEVFRLANMWLITDVMDVMCSRLESESGVPNSLKLWFAVAYKLPVKALSKYADKMIHAIINGNLSRSDYEILGAPILGILTEASINSLRYRMNRARHVPPYHQPENCRKGKLCAYGWREAWRFLYSKILLKGSSGEEVHWRLDDHQTTIPDVCAHCMKYTLDKLYDSQYLFGEEDILRMTVMKLEKLVILVVSTFFLCLRYLLSSNEATHRTRINASPTLHVLLRSFVLCPYRTISLIIDLHDCDCPAQLMVLYNCTYISNHGCQGVKLQSKNIL